MSSPSNGSLYADALPPLLPLTEHRRLGVSRNAVYRGAAEKKVTLRKLGRRTFIDTASAMSWLAGLPEAKIGGGK
jgi:hypothetical protein